MDQLFFTPKLSGRRFEDHSIPVEMLEDFNQYEELLFKVAKWIYYEEHNKQKVPKGFGHGVSLKLSSLSNGSAIANMALAASTFMVGDLDTYPIYVKARDKIAEVIEKADKDEDFTKILPHEFLGYFNKIGKRLKDDEYISFSTTSLQSAKLNNNSRRRLVLSVPSIEDFRVFTSFRGAVSGYDKADRMFTVVCDNGQKVNIKIESEHVETFLQAFFNYEGGQRIMVKGIGLFNKSDKLISLELDSVTLLDKLDVPTRLNEFTDYKEGWFDGISGKEFNRSGIEWLSNLFDEYFQPDILLPYTFPTPEGEVQFEWKKENHDLTLYVDILNKSAYMHYQNMKDDNDSYEEDLNLNNEEGWKELLRIVSNYFKA